MLYRVAFIFIAIFWVTMNVLLWRSEYRQEDAVGSEIPIETILRKILTSPDTSQLEVIHQGNTLGFCRWATEAVGASTTQTGAAELEVEDMVTRLANYHAAFEGNIALHSISNRLRFEFDAILATNLDWQEFRLTLGVRPVAWEFRSVAAEQKMYFQVKDETGSFEQDFSFADLRNPQALLAKLGGAVPAGLLANAGLPLSLGDTTNANRPVALGIVWRARETWLKFGGSSVRVYRLETRLLDRYPVVIIVSRAGEILRVDLPNGVRLVNDQLNAP